MSRNNIAKKSRCQWSLSHEEHIKYHDEEWGVPVHDDQKLFEFLLLDGFQAGLSWLTILKKREGFRKAFSNFDVQKVSRYRASKVEKLVLDASIVRHRGKIESSVTNAKAFIAIQKEFSSFDKYIWQFTGGKTIKNKWKTMDDVPAKTDESEAMSKDLKKRGFKFVGSTICYAFMQASGMVNDHVVSCFRYKEVGK